MKGGCNSYKVFGFSRKFKLSEAQPPQDVIDIFASFTDGGEYMSAEQMLHFLGDQQEMECTLPEAEQIIEQILQKRRGSDNPSGDSSQGLSLDDFFHYLFMPEFNGPIKTQVSTLFLVFLSFPTYPPISHFIIYWVLVFSASFCVNSLAAYCNNPIRMNSVMLLITLLWTGTS